MLFRLLPYCQFSSYVLIRQKKPLAGLQLAGVEIVVRSADAVLAIPFADHLGCHLVFHGGNRFRVLGFAS